MLRTARVPPEFEPIFAAAEEAVERFFRSRKDDPEHGTIEIMGERYLLVRAASLSVEFFGLVEQLFGPGREAEADQFARNILFDLAHALGKSDARNFQDKMNLVGPLEKLSAGPVIFSRSGWAFVDILPESRPVPNDDYYLLFDHPYSFESDAWLRAGKSRHFPVCIMSAGFSSGWCEESFGLQLVSVEVMCRAKGDETCRFIMAPPKRIEQYTRAFDAASAGAASGGSVYEIPDFFARKRAEEELLGLYERLKELDTLKTELFANVSHELRTPLMLISGPVEKLLTDARLTDDQRSSLEVVQRNARILLKHVNDLLDVAKLEAGRTEARHARTDLVELVRVVAANFDALASDRQIAYRVETGESLLAEVDPEKIGRVLLNLLSNAFAFAHHSVRVSLRAQDDHGLLEVADDGPGVPPPKREVIFERFRRVEGGAARQFGGTGLGLAIAKDFVKLHGGEISVADAPEGGALFAVTLPVLAPTGVTVLSAAATSTLLEAIPAPQKGVRVSAAEPVERAAEDAPLVLIVEDNVDMVNFIAATLAKYRIATAKDGQEGLEKACELRPDLILTDIMLPRRSGESLVHEVRQYPYLAATPIIVITARADDEQRVRLLGEGALDYMAKPFLPNELLARIKNLIALKNARDILETELTGAQGDLEELAREVTSRKRELEDALQGTRIARDHAERASQAKTMFLGLVSHELTTPLQSMCLNLESLQKRPAGLSTEQIEKVSKVERASHRLVDMIDALIEFVRLESGGLEVRREEVSLPDMARQVLEDLGAQARQKGLEVWLEMTTNIPPVQTDARLVRLILVNLIGNAVKYTDRGNIEVSITRDDSACRVRVKDTGRGIPPEKLTEIFEPFTQLEALRHKHGRGVGLGLTLVREMAKALRGKISTCSELGRGSTFTLELPMT